MYFGRVETTAQALVAAGEAGALNGGAVSAGVQFRQTSSDVVGRAPIWVDCWLGGHWLEMTETADDAGGGLLGSLLQAHKPTGETTQEDTAERHETAKGHKCTNNRKTTPAALGSASLYAPGRQLHTMASGTRVRAIKSSRRPSTSNQRIRAPDQPKSAQRQQPPAQTKKAAHSLIGKLANWQIG